MDASVAQHLPSYLSVDYTCWYDTSTLHMTILVLAASNTASCACTMLYACKSSVTWLWLQRFQAPVPYNLQACCCVCRTVLLLCIPVPPDIQRGMGAVQDRNQTTGAVVLRAVVCPENYYGVVGVNASSDGVYKKYGKVASPCTQCPTNMVTGYSSASQVTSIKAIDSSDSLKQAVADQAVTTGGYYAVDACFTQPGYGEEWSMAGNAVRLGGGALVAPCLTRTMCVDKYQFTQP